MTQINKIKTKKILVNPKESDLSAFHINLNKLKSLVFQFEKSYDEEKKKLINSLLASKTFKTDDFKHLHQTLLCILAYSNNKVMFDFVNVALFKLVLGIEQNLTLQTRLVGTGIYQTPIECNFSFEKVCFIIEKLPNQVSIHSANSTIETQKASLKLVLPFVEYAKIHEGEKDFKTRILFFTSCKTQTDLEWLIQSIQQTNLPNETKAFIYNQLGIFIQWKVYDLDSSVSFLRGPSLLIYFHTKPLNKKINFENTIKRQLPTPVKLTVKEKHSIIDSAKMTLFYLYRETEPFKNANTEDITLFQLDNGISIALYGSSVAKRYSLESYIGYLVFKNNIPASYGGGWLFGERCQFGINILEAFRGGESSLIICELLRVYHQQFGATCFVVKPYQFGLHNAEAIKTGAFWFYYKFGFRPENQDLKELAHKEEKEKLTNPKYKSTTATLKQYTKSNLELVLSTTSFPNYDAEVLSKKMTSYINAQFNGNRELALDFCFNQLNKNLELSIHDWNSVDLEYAKQISVICCMKPNSAEWQNKNKKNILLLITLKSSKTELPWIRHLQKFKSFL